MNKTYNLTLNIRLIYLFNAQNIQFKSDNFIFKFSLVPLGDPLFTSGYACLGYLSPHRHELHFLLHLPAKSPSNICPKPYKCVFKVLEPQDNFWRRQIFERQIQPSVRLSSLLWTATESIVYNLTSSSLLNPLILKKKN